MGRIEEHRVISADPSRLPICIKCKLFWIISLPELVLLISCPATEQSSVGTQLRMTK